MKVIWGITGEKAASRMSSVHTIAIICEDDSDFKSLKVIIQSITGKTNLSFKKKSAGGCGMIKRKALAWSEEFHRKGCDLLLIIHDRDRNDYNKLEEQLRSIMKTSSFKNRYICIPVEELEAWFLSDPQALKDALNLDRLPKIAGLPETIDSPKEYIQNQAASCSQNKVMYINTIHNEKIAKLISIDQMLRRAPTFKLFHDYIDSYSYS